ncbi:MarR family winged helix-turn-helix transcriptional regulator [Nitriliruptor alkaliphilus]|uniref:MarR family winged helix-turn-helix transcriptional regulator n=1 Tax=Nitriliruptor alkaliphilus TaxID=427918 RepID=UPI000698B399|nr:MarR family transcriptional regulator [Nitriliruptor alkaliphilus]
MSSTDAVPRLERLPSRLLSRAALLASRLVNEALDELNGHRHEFAVLVTLDEAGPASQAELCRRCGLDRSDMTALVESLANIGHVLRLTDPEDGRRKIVHLEPAGRTRLNELEVAINAAQDALLDGWKAADRERLVSLLLPLASRSGR